MDNSQAPTTKHASVYPIPNGNELNIFTSTEAYEIQIKDLQGNIVCLHSSQEKPGSYYLINIKGLPPATYIVEAYFVDNSVCRSVFAKV